MRLLYNMRVEYAETPSVRGMEDEDSPTHTLADLEGGILMKRAGQIVLFRFPHTDLEEGELRPALLLGRLPGG